MRFLIGLAVAVMVSCAPAVSNAKVLYSPVLATSHDTDTFHCAFTNIHTRNTAGISYFIFDYVTNLVVDEGVLFLARLRKVSDV
jgi:hypothetical protein